MCHCALDVVQFLRWKRATAASQQCPSAMGLHRVVVAVELLYGGQNVLDAAITESFLGSKATNVIVASRIAFASNVI